MLNGTFVTFNEGVLGSKSLPVEKSGATETKWTGFDSNGSYVKWHIDGERILPEIKNGKKSGESHQWYKNQCSNQLSYYRHKRSS